MVGVLGIEPRASCSQNRRATAAPHPVINIELDDVAISVEPTIKNCHNHILSKIMVFSPLIKSK